jgi:hypothetical protein
MILLAANYPAKNNGSLKLVLHNTCSQIRQSNNNQTLHRLFAGNNKK